MVVKIEMFMWKQEGSGWNRPQLKGFPHHGEPRQKWRPHFRVTLILPWRYDAGMGTVNSLHAST